MTKWEALQAILDMDAETFKTQSEGMQIKAKLSLDPAEQQQLQAMATVLAIQVAAASHYREVMDDLDKQEEQLTPTLPEPDLKLVDN